MPCIPFSRDGARGFLCTSAKRKRCVGCGRTATLECDWKVPTRKSGTCDAPLCATCSHKPAPGKDLCPPHRDQWLARRR